MDNPFDRLQNNFATDFQTHLEKLKQTHPDRAVEMARLQWQAFLSQPAKSSIYVCGLKPYGQNGKGYASSQKQLPENYHAYLDEKWSTPYVKRALQLIQLIQEKIGDRSDDARSVFVTNWFWQRAVDAAQLRKLGWTLETMTFYHQSLLDYFQPRVILCIGNGNQFSAFAGMCELYDVNIKKVNQKKYIDRSALKYFKQKNRIVLGVPHLSRYGFLPQMEQWLATIFN